MKKLQKKLVLLCTALSLVGSTSQAVEIFNSPEHVDQKKKVHSKEATSKKNKVKKHFAEEDNVKVIYVKETPRTSAWAILGKMMFISTIITGVAITGALLIGYEAYKNDKKNPLVRAFDSVRGKPSFFEYMEEIAKLIPGALQEIGNEVEKWWKKK